MNQVKIRSVLVLEGCSIVVIRDTGQLENMPEGAYSVTGHYRCSCASVRTETDVEWGSGSLPLCVVTLVLGTVIATLCTMKVVCRSTCIRWFSSLMVVMVEIA